MRTQPISRVLSWICCVLPAILLVYLEFVVPFVARARQVKTTADMQSLRRTLQQYHDRHGRFPALLADAVLESGGDPKSIAYFSRGIDGWGNQLRYEARASGGYVLVSYGRDERADNVDYWWVRSTSSTERYALEACRNFDADIIASDVQFHRTCGK